MIIPFKGKVVIEPIKQEMLLSQDSSLIEAGKVLKVGEGVKFLKVGDTVHFNSWCCDKTAEIDGKVFYILPVNEQSILGKCTKKANVKSKVTSTTI